MIDASFSDRLLLVMKAIALSRGQLAADLGVDKSVVSRWLSGATIPTDHNLARVTARVARHVPGFTMLDWNADADTFAARLGIADLNGSTEGVPAADLPAFAALSAFVPSRHETAARGGRYCGLWESIMPTFGRPDAFHREHTVIRQDGAWLSGEAIGVIYRWELIGFVADSQLVLWMSSPSDFIFRHFNRADELIVDQVDGLMLGAASLPHQAPTACRVIMSRLLPPDADGAAIAAVLEARAAERCFFDAGGLPPGMEDALLPDCGPAAAKAGGERLLRTDPTFALVRTRWF